jgi:hypothetical protein
VFGERSSGVVFSIGSIIYCGSFWRNGGLDGPISRLLANVVRSFALQAGVPPTSPPVFE